MSTENENPMDENIDETMESEMQEVEAQEKLDALLELSDKELRSLAMDAVEGRLFGTWMCNSADEMRGSFPILGLVDQAWMDDMAARDVVHFYEQVSKAAPLAVNGRPMFFSANALTRKDFERLVPLINMLIDQRKQFLGDDA